MEAGWSGPTKHVKPTAETTISLSQIQVKHGGGGREDEDGGDGGDGSGGEDEDGDDGGDGGDVVVVKKKLVMMVKIFDGAVGCFYIGQVDIMQ